MKRDDGGQETRGWACVLAGAGKVQTGEGGDHNVEAQVNTNQSDRSRPPRSITKVYLPSLPFRATSLARALSQYTPQRRDNGRGRAVSPLS